MGKLRTPCACGQLATVIMPYASDDGEVRACRTCFMAWLQSVVPKQRGRRVRGVEVVVIKYRS